MSQDRTDQFQGYRGVAKSTLAKFGVGVWSEVEIRNNAGSIFKGVILPRSETYDDLHIVIKLFTGYNVGLSAERIVEARETGYRRAVYKIPEKDFPVDPGKNKVTLLGTGGTIASRLDYRTGAVIPAFTPGELYGAVPELADITSLMRFTLPANNTWTGAFPRASSARPLWGSTGSSRFMAVASRLRICPWKKIPVAR